MRYAELRTSEDVVPSANVVMVHVALIEGCAASHAPVATTTATRASSPSAGTSTPSTSGTSTTPTNQTSHHLLLVSVQSGLAIK